MIAAPILLASAVYLEVARHLIAAAILVLMSFVLTVRSSCALVLLLLNVPLYFMDGFEYIQKASKSWFAQSPHDEDVEQTASLSSPSVFEAYQVTVAQQTVMAEPSVAISPLSRCSVFTSTVLAEQEVSWATIAAQLEA